ncbi:claudin-4-like [Peromyscus californicus insignis]|uniref:claudin-4-like n=1 Tax=Peromyscus californicus insignis TaxID=564181 RepID=UPI0022A6E967|nr:claudin-4-like [Peromyscus californicus insignis]
MGRREMEAAGFSLVLLGWLVAIISCSLPLWRVTKVSEETSLWEGLWNLCDAERLQNVSCMPYNSLLVLPQELQGSRVLVVICIIIISMGLLLYISRDKLITDESNMSNEGKIKMAASGLFLGAGLLMLVSVSWVTHNVIIDMYNSTNVYQWKPEMGASVYLGWLSSLLLLLGGALLGGTLQ